MAVDALVAYNLWEIERVVADSVEYKVLELVDDVQ